LKIPHHNESLQQFYHQQHQRRKQIMKSSMLTLVLAVGLVGAHDALAQKKMPPKKNAVLLPYESIKWESAGEELPGVQIAQLHGDMTRGAYAAYVKLPAGFAFPLHYHGNDQWGTVVSGTLIIGMESGEEMRLGAGSYVYMPKGVRHTTAAGEEGCVFLEASTEKESTTMVQGEERKKK
jgi:quercetin dioxygenase-like cupin family protein